MVTPVASPSSATDMTTASPVVGVIGLGVMGSAMSSHVIAGGHRTVGFDTDPTRLREFGGEALGSAADVAADADVVLLSLPTVEALEAVTAEVRDVERPDLVLVEMGTFPLEAKEAAYRALGERDMMLLDAPVSGTGLQAADATLVVYASGDDDAFARAEPILDLVGRKTYHLGDFGNGSRMKFVANLLVAIHTLAAAEAHRLGAAAGLDPAVLQEVIGAGVGSSRIFDIRGPMMASETYEPPSARLSIILKDATIIAEAARDLDSPTPLLDAALPIYQAGVAAGLGDLDAASLRSFLDQEPARG